MVLLLSAYDLGRQPFGLASPAAWLRRAGFAVRAHDLSLARLPSSALDGVTLVAVHLPMHTATRLALPVVAAIRQRLPSLPMCAYGLYAPLNRVELEAAGITAVVGPEAEATLVDLAAAAAAGSALGTPPPAPLPRLAFIPPDRRDLPPLTAYARLRRTDGTLVTAGATEASRGCKHRCRHCPIVPVYDGRFRVVPVEVVMADVATQVAAGAAHISFGDPDFLNAPTHARRVVEALHAAWPALTYDVTIKVEHLRAHDAALPVLRDTGCQFVTTAVESFDDAVLARLAKGHTAADVAAVVARCRDVGLALSPTFIAFTPWTTRDGYAAFLDEVERLDLVGHVAPVQLTLRLLVTARSRLLELDDVRRRVGAFDARSLTHPWRHDDPAMDDLQREAMRLVAAAPAGGDRGAIFAAVRQLADRARGMPARTEPPRRSRATIPYLTEPWYC
ncbi:MAG: CUAEP/CCAEP-tail radical SAM (seleno)protein [Vicinamibacterales bacterium]